VNAGDRQPCPQCGALNYVADDICVGCGFDLPPPGKAEPALPPIPEDAEAHAQPEAPLPPLPPSAPVPYLTLPGREQPWDPLALGWGGGLLGNVTRGWAFLRESLVMWRRDRDLMVPPVLSVVSQISVLGLCCLVLYLTGAWWVIWGDDAFISLLRWFCLIPVALVSWAIALFYTGMTINLVDTHLKGQDARLGPAFWDSLRNINALASLTATRTAVGAGASLIRQYGGIAGSLAATGVEQTADVATRLVMPVIIIEDLPFHQAVSRAWQLWRGRLSDAVVAALGIKAVIGLITLATLMVGAGVGMGLHALSAALLPVAIGLGVALLLVVMSFTSYLSTAFYTCLYVWAAATEQAQQPIAAPAPIAAALARAGGW
jgi:hypothetical protein